MGKCSITPGDYTFNELAFYRKICTTKKRLKLGQASESESEKEGRGVHGGIKLTA